MKIQAILFLLFFASCCDCQQQRLISHDAVKDSVIFAMPMTTAYPAENAKLDFGFYYDTPVPYATKPNYAYQAYYPQSKSKDLSALNAYIATLVNRLIEYNSPGNDLSAATTAEIWTHSFFMDQRLISICIADQSFTEGAANYNHNFHGINYDPAGGNFLSFGDILSIHDHPDDVLEFVNYKVGNYRNTFKNLKELYAEKEFYINDEGLFMYGWETAFKVFDITDVRKYRKG